MDLSQIRRQRSVVKCIWVKFKWVEISKSVVKGSEGLRNRVSIIIRIYSYIDRMRFVVYRVVLFISFFFIYLWF